MTVFGFEVIENMNDRKKKRRVKDGEYVIARTLHYKLC